MKTIQLFQTWIQEHYPGVLASLGKDDGLRIVVSFESEPPNHYHHRRVIEFYIVGGNLEVDSYDTQTWSITVQAIPLADPDLYHKLGAILQKLRST